MAFDSIIDAAPIRTAPLGLPLLAYIQKDPLAAGSRFQSRFGDVARLNVLFRRAPRSPAADRGRAQTQRVCSAISGRSKNEPYRHCGRCCGSDG